MQWQVTAYPISIYTSNLLITFTLTPLYIGDAFLLVTKCVQYQITGHKLQ